MNENIVVQMRNIMRLLTAFMFLTVLGLECAAADENDIYKTNIIYEFSLDKAEGIQGKAREWLINKGKAARFVMIGEVHGVADIPVFADAVYDITDRTALAIETDVWTANKLEELASSGDDGFDQYFTRRSHQFGIPFYSWKEEAVFLKAVVKKADGIKPSVWGLDQVFVLGGKLIAERLRGKIKTKEARLALDEFENKLITRPVLVGYGNIDDIEPLYLALLSEKDPEVQEIAEALKASNAIYAPFTKGFGSALLANQRREQQMKELFFTYFSRARKYVGLQKPMLKFGRFHMYRGITPTGVLGLGSFVDALATARGEKTLAISMFCGEGSASRQFDGSVEGCSNDDIKKSTPLIAKLASEAEGNVLIDTLALRVYGAELLELASDSEREQFAAFDAIVIIKNSDPATQFDTTIEDMDLVALLKAEGEQ
jgi:hypothetical protein